MPCAAPHDSSALRPVVAAQERRNARVLMRRESWSIVGQRDFNGDGKYMWQTTTDTAIWLMNGLRVTQLGLLGQILTNWSIVGTVDFNGDGKGDILWRSDTGVVASG